MPDSPGGASLVDHYARNDDVAAGIGDALAAAGFESSDRSALAGAEEFHLGGRVATDAILEQFELDSSTVHLDVGCGIGGLARRMADRFGSTVVGVDLTPSFVDTANELSSRVGLDHLTHFRVGDVRQLADLGLEAQLGPDGVGFDSATLVHVGMNVANKAPLVQAVHDGLAPGGRFVVYDIMRVGEGELTFPMPWASNANDSFVEEPDVYVEALTQAGFTVASVTDLSELALEAMAAVAGAPINLGHLMGPEFPNMIKNLLPRVKAGVLAPIEIVADRSASD